MVDVTPYVDVEEAQTFFDGRLNTYAWDAASDPDKLKGLKEASSRIDRLQFQGCKLLESQEREFPRDFQTQVPEDIKQACCLIAISLLDGVDIEIENKNLSVITQSFQGSRTTYEPSVRRDHFRHGIPSVEAWECLKPYLADGQELEIRRV